MPLEDVESKTKTIQNLKMNLKESRIQVSELVFEKRKMEECDRDYKERASDEIKSLKQALRASNENNVLFESELRREMKRLKIEFLQKDTNEMTQDDGVDVSSRPLMVRLTFCFTPIYKIVPLTIILRVHREETNGIVKIKLNMEKCGSKTCVASGTFKIQHPALQHAGVKAYIQS